MDDQDGANFVIHGPGLRLVATGGCHLLAPTVPATELRGEWASILYATRLLRAEHLIIKGDSTTVISWIHEAIRTPPMHSFMRDIAFLL